jgi:hypothetical protein
MNTHQKTRVRLTAVIAATIGSLVVSGTTSAITPDVAGRAVVKAVHVKNQAPCPDAHGDSSLGEVLASRNTAGGRALYR